MIKINSSVLVGGSRTLSAPAAAAAACSAFTRSLLKAGCVLSVGCATGADQIALNTAVCSKSFSQVRAFAAFTPAGNGSFGGSAVKAMQAAARAGVAVTWLAGGSLSVPLVARLMARSLAALRGCSAAVFFSPGVGSLKVARAALRAGTPVLISCAGLSTAPALAIAPSSTVVFGQPFWLFAPAVQPALF